MAKSSSKRRHSHSLARTLAALLGSVPLALGSGSCLALLLPLPASSRYLAGSFSVFPIWTALCLWTLHAASSRRAWLGVVTASAVLGVLSMIGLSLGGGLALGPAP